MISRFQALLAVLVLAVLSSPVAGVWAAEDQASTPPTQTDVQLEVGWQSWSTEGNPRRFQQYVTPPENLYLSELVLRRLDPTGGASFEFMLSGFGEPDVAGSLWYHGTGLNLHSQYRRSRFFAEFDPLSGANRRADYFVGLYPGARPRRDFTWSVDLSEVSMIGAPTSGPVDWSDARQGAGLGWRVGDYWLDLNFEREDFEFGVGTEYAGDTTSYSVAFTPASSARSQVSGGFVRQVTDLDAVAKTVRSWNAYLNAWYGVSRDLDLTGEARHFEIDRTIVKNAYARRQTLGRVEAEYRVHPTMTLLGFAQTALTDYVDGLQLNTLGVDSQTVGVGFRARPSRALKLRGQYRRYDTHHRPLSYNSDSTLADTLIYSTVQRTDLSATYAPGGTWGLSADWQRRTWENDAQPIQNSMGSLGLTGWWQTLEGKLSLTASCLLQDFDLPLMVPVPGTGFTSKAVVWVLGATYVVSPRDTVYATFTDSVISGANSNEYQRVTVGASHVVGPRDRLEVEVNFGDFWDDYDPTLDFGSDLWRVAYRHQF